MLPVVQGADAAATASASEADVAAFVITAALFASAPRGTTVCGYPLLTIVFLALAALTAGWVGIGMVRKDLPQRRTGRR